MARLRVSMPGLLPPAEYRAGTGAATYLSQGAGEAAGSGPMDHNTATPKGQRNPHRRPWVPLGLEDARGQGLSAWGFRVASVSAFFRAGKGAEDVTDRKKGEETWGREKNRSQS